MKTNIKIDWKQLIESIGLSDAEIARRVVDLGVKTTQETINRVKNRKISAPRHDLGEAILRVREDKMRVGS